MRRISPDVGRDATDARYDLTNSGEANGAVWETNFLFRM